MVSSESSGEMTADPKNRVKPQAVVQYNQFMCGVDRKDQFLSYYSCDKKTVRWYKKVELHIIQMMVLKSYLFYRQFKRPDLTFRQFREEVVKRLLELPEDTGPGSARGMTINEH